MFQKSLSLILALSLTIISLVSIPASAHAVVKPAEVKPSSFERFALGVPVEKEIPTVGIRLVIPEGLNYVTPYVKTGWKIETKKDSSMEPKITEISWTEGSIPVGQKDEFIFAAQAPVTESSIKWKAYQTYSDGSVVNWDMEPASEGKKSDEGSTPYSVTKVITPIANTASVVKNDHMDQESALLYVLVGLSLLVSIGTGVYIGRLKK